MACQHIEHEVVSSSSPGCFCNNASGLNDLLYKWENNEESGEILENYYESKHVLRVCHR